MDFEALIRLFYGNLEKQGPGDDDVGRAILNRLPINTINRIIDVGCGTGRQSFMLAGALKKPIFTIDTFLPFLKKINEKAGSCSDFASVIPVCMDMRDLHLCFSDVDLIWCESAVYNMGFEQALGAWRRLLTEKGFMVISDLAWINENYPEEIGNYFKEAYPSMKHHKENLEIINRNGYKLIHSEVLPKSAWEDGYYTPLEQIALDITNHSDTDVKNYAHETLTEIEMFRKYHAYYAYIIYVMQV